MWPRVVELMLGCWIAVSPFVFRYSTEDTWLWINDFTAATLIVISSCMSFYRPLERMHLLTLAVAIWLIVFGFIAEAPPPPPPYQNYVMTGFLICLFAILPSRSSQPPRRWQAYYNHDLLD